FSRSGWLWPVDAKGEPLKATSYMAVGFYVAKYVNKKSDMDLAAKGLGAKEWNNSLKTKLSLLPKKLFRIRMSRNFGMKMQIGRASCRERVQSPVIGPEGRKQKPKRTGAKEQGPHTKS